MRHAAKIAVMLCSLTLLAPARAGTLMELWQGALATNPAYAATRAQGGADRLKRREAAALHAPRVSLSAGARYQTLEQETAGARFSGPGFGSNEGVAFDTRHGGALGVGWSLDLRHSLYSADRDAAARQLDIRARLGEVAIEAARQRLMVEVAQGYFDLLAAEDQVEALARMEAATREARDRADARYRAGDAPVTDRNDAEARFDLIGAELLAARNELAVRRARLEDLTGRFDVAPRRPTAAASDPVGDAAALADWQRRAGATNPRIKNGALQAESAAAEVARLRAAVSPTVDVYARIEGDRLRGDGYGGDGERTLADRALGVQLTVPLWTGGLRGAQAGQAALLKQRSRAELQAAEQEVRRAVRENWLALDTRRAQARALEVALRSAAARLDATRTGFEVGERPMIDVLDAQQALYAAERELAAARYASFVARLALYASVGELDETHLQEIDAGLR